MNQRSFHFEDVIAGRSSVRAFRTEPVDPAQIQYAIEMAGWAPSPHGTQPWKFVVAESQEARERLAHDMAVTWITQLQQDGADAQEVERRAARSQERLTTAPVVVILCLDLARAHAYLDPERQQAEYMMAVQSLGAAAQNFLLGIYAVGLDAGWMCAPLFVPEQVRQSLGLKAELVPHAMFPVGHMSAPPRRRPRLPPEELVAAWL